MSGIGQVDSQVIGRNMPALAQFNPPDWLDGLQLTSGQRHFGLVGVGLGVGGYSHWLNGLRQQKNDCN
jgi:hypothetical protein